MAKLPNWKPPKRFKPFDYLKGDQLVGKKYTAWNTYGGGKPDFGKGKGPGDPYRQIQKTVPTAQAGKAQEALWKAQQGLGGAVSTSKPKTQDPRVEAIRRRLRGL